MPNQLGNWVNLDANKQQVENANVVLKNLKKKKYSSDKKFKLVKVSDHPLTYKEVPVGKKVVIRTKTIKEKFDDFELLDSGMSKSTEVVLPKEEIIEATLTLRDIDFGMGPGTVEINIHD